MQSPPKDLAAVLEEGRQLGLIGPGPVETQILHAAALCTLVEDHCGEPSNLLDLGSGGGLPGLVAAVRFQHTRATLLDSRSRSTTFLERAIDRLHVEDRVEVVCARAEVASHDPEFREKYAVVFARAVGPAPVVAELGAAFVALGGFLVVSERPGGSMWSEDGCRELGLGLDSLVGSGEASARFLRKQHSTPARWPRRTGVPAKRPIW